MLNNLFGNYEISIKGENKGTQILIKGSKVSILSGFSLLVDELLKSDLTEKEIRETFELSFKSDKEIQQEIEERLDNLLDKIKKINEEI